MTLFQQLDHLRKLSVQAKSVGIKVVYTASGKLVTATMLNDETVIVEHKAYWCPVRTIDEARYLVAILNSALVLRYVAPQHTRGEFNPRDIDKLVWGLPIPMFDERDPVHRDLAAAAAAAARAEAVAGGVELADVHFVTKRRAIRSALAADGVAQDIELPVAALLA